METEQKDAHTATNLRMKNHKHFRRNPGKWER